MSSSENIELKKLKKREYDKSWRLKNIDKIKETAKRWRNNNKEIRTQKRLKYKLDNMIKVRLSEIKSKCNKKNIDFNLDENFIQELLIKQNNKCYYSNIEFIQFDKFYGFSIDRTDSTKGYLKNNITLVCTIVNKMKNSLNENEFKNIIQKIYVKFYETRATSNESCRK